MPEHRVAPVGSVSSVSPESTASFLAQLAPTRNCGSLSIKYEPAPRTLLEGSAQHETVELMHPNVDGFPGMSGPEELAEPELANGVQEPPEDPRAL